MIVLKKTSRLGRAHLERTGTLTVATPPPAALEVGAKVKLLAGPFEGREGRVRWAGDAGGQARIGVVVPGVEELQFVNLEHAKEIP